MSHQVQYFLGANSSEGFCSFYDTLFRDPRVSRVWIIKGGAGNGKSTFMRAMGQTAAEQGAETESILCSSDPDSLDGVVIPAIGLAIVDGTAPHVVEPVICGLGSRYIDFSGCYRKGMEAAREEIDKARTANQACYPKAYACLRAAAVLQRQMEQVALNSTDLEKIDSLADGILATELPDRGKQGNSVRWFISGITPKGFQYRLESINALCKKLYAFSDSFGLSHRLLARLYTEAMRRGYFCITGHSPLMPTRIEQLLIPELEVGFLRTAQSMTYHGPTYCQVELDALAELDEGDKSHMPFLMCTGKALVQEAIVHLQQAKAHHDALELACRPYVDFSAVSALREQYAQQVVKLLGETEHP